MSAVVQARPPYDVEALRAEFPILARQVRGKPLAYLDNAATSQKPRRVLAAEADYYAQANANVHRGVHWLSERATELYEGARAILARHVNARATREIVFARGTTEAINLVSQSWARPRLKPGDEILVTWLEHHSNIVPWQLVCQQTGAALKAAPITDAGAVDLDAFAALLSSRTRLVAIGHVSNALGTVNPVRRIVELAHAAGARVLIDGAQAVPHLAVDVQALDCDFYAFSAHKMYGPTGAGALWARETLLEAMPPWQGGGDMIRVVSFGGSQWNELPWKFEAGTPNIAGAIGFGAAASFLAELGLDRVHAHEDDLLRYATARLAAVPGLRIVGTAPDKAAVVSFVMDAAHPHDIGTIVDAEGVAIRTGHHCAMPVMERFGLPATARASFALYNTRAEVDRLVAALDRVREVFG
jgi:cysteine desulfurase/selenocysteine lyase